MEKLCSSEELLLLEHYQRTLSIIKVKEGPTTIYNVCDFYLTVAANPTEFERFQQKAMDPIQLQGSLQDSKDSYGILMISVAIATHLLEFQ